MYQGVMNKTINCTTGPSHHLTDNPRYYRLDFITGAPGGDITLIHSPARITSRRGEQIYDPHSGSEEKHPSFHLINDGIV